MPNSIENLQFYNNYALNILKMNIISNEKRKCNKIFLIKLL